MSVLISNDAGIDQILSNEEIAGLIEAVLEAEQVARACEVSVSVVDKDEIHGLNRTWRGIDKPTDVLSFECDAPDDPRIPEGELVELGDIIVAPEVIAAQAPGFGNTPADEMRLMLVHGTLHLLGYDHIEDDEAEVMEAREDELLRELCGPNVQVGPTTHHAHD